MNDSIVIKGAREHNLKNVDLTIPKNKMVVFTGVSGSGKSSLAFDTIYAEGQRRYVESLSSYARQFLGVMDKPDVDFIEGLSPSISIDQKSVGKNPRSTVGTITEIYDYLRLLYARIGVPYCPNDGTLISRLSIDEITEKIVEYSVEYTKKYKLAPQQFLLLSPIVTERKGEFTPLFGNLRSKGYTDLIVDGTRVTGDKLPALEKNNKHTISAVIMSFSLSHADTKNKDLVKSLKKRIAETVEQGVKLSDGKILLQAPESSHLFSEKFACPQCDFALAEIEPRMFSFNSPVGACETCKGLGYIVRIAPELVLNRRLSIEQGAIVPFGKVLSFNTWYARTLKTVLDDLNIDTSVNLSYVDEDKLQILLHGNNKTYKVHGQNRFGNDTVIKETFIGIIPELYRRYGESSSEFMSHEIEKYMTDEECTACHGMRLKPEVLSIKIDEKNIIDLASFSIETLLTFTKNIHKGLSGYNREVSENIITEIIARLTFLENVGLTYLTLGRTAASLSGGESQRIRLASQIGSGLTGVIYVLDEPSIGLHSKDVAALVDSLRNLCNLGNTLIVVEHDTETILAADHIVDFGPKAGKHGGKVIFQGSLEELKKSKNSLTAKYMFKKNIAHEHTLSPKNYGYIEITGCKQFNLKNVSAKFPLGNLISVTGVSGSGKSTLIVETLYKALRYYLEGSFKLSQGTFDQLLGYQYLDKVYLVDQSSIGKTPRSNPATYMGIFDHIRDIFAQTPDAKIRGFAKGRFSFNVKGGRCEKCQGAGTIKIEMQFLPDVYVKCDVCKGARYNSQTLEVLYKGKSIKDVLDMPIDEAAEFFKSIPQLAPKLKTLQDVGVGYMELGQSAPTLSGGEAQRIKLANELAKKETGRTLYILDEPTTGLHLYDVEKLLATLYKLVEKGNTVIVIEHNLEVIKNSQYVIDMGPLGGQGGGQLLYQGPLGGLLENKDSFTGKYLSEYLR